MRHMHPRYSGALELIGGLAGLGAGAAYAPQTAEFITKYIPSERITNMLCGGETLAIRIAGAVAGVAAGYLLGKASGYPLDYFSHRERMERNAREIDAQRGFMSAGEIARRVKMLDEREQSNANAAGSRENAEK